MQGCNLQVLGLMSFFTPPLSTLLLTWVSGAGAGWPVYGGLLLILAAAWLGGRGQDRGRDGRLTSQEQGDP